MRHTHQRASAATGASRYIIAPVWINEVFPRYIIEYIMMYHAVLWQIYVYSLRFAVNSSS
jgi:hypothetical protein